MIKTSAEDLAIQLGLTPVRGRREWRGGCPACGYPSGLVLSKREGRALLWCASCQDKGAMASILRGDGARPIPTRQTPARPQRDDAGRIASARRIWEGAHHLEGSPGEAYLSRRGLASLVATPALRFHPAASHPSGVQLPALVALVLACDGHAVGIHRTYLASGGVKASVEPQKATLGPVWGGAIRLDPLAEEIVIGEGIETSASAGVLLGLPAWAAISAGNLGKGLILPAEVRSVVIAADPGGPGEREAMNAARRWHAEGRHVRIARTGSDTDDFNDILREGAHHA